MKGEWFLIPPGVPLGIPDLTERLAWRQAQTYRRLRDEGPPSNWQEPTPDPEHEELRRRYRASMMNQACRGD